jgi:hypothetical protein
MGRHQSGKVIILTARGHRHKQIFDLLFLCGPLVMDDVSLDVNEVYHLVSAYQTGGWLSPGEFLRPDLCFPASKSEHAAIVNQPARCHDRS